MSRTALARVALAVALTCISFVQTARADTVQQTNVTHVDEDDGPSVFSQGWQGLLAGAATGAAGGYLFARNDGFEGRSDWRAVGLGLGIGSLTGAAVGFSLGLIDKGGAPAGRYVARDLLAGAGFGAAVGAIGGGISAIAQDDAEHVLFGAAIGTVAGAGLGIITGVIEGATKSGESRRVARRVQPTLALSRDVNGASLALPGLAGRF